MAEADNKYANGKIYELVYKDKVYIGSTTTTLADRYNGHKRDPRCTSRELFEMAKADGSEVVINLVEDYPCASKVELEARERFHMELCQDRVNRKIPGRGWSDYYQANRDKLIAYQMEYRSINKDKVAAQKAKFYQANKAEIAARKAVKVECPCGVTHRHNDKARQERSQHHVDYLSRLRATAN
jgi:hypothetical protein